MTTIPGYTPSGSTGTASTTSGTSVSGFNVPQWGTGTTTTTKYLGGGSNFAPVPWQNRYMPFGKDIAGYTNGDQVSLLPSNAQDMAALQQSLFQAGYLTQAQYNNLVLGSPDPVTTAAFAKLLATANYSGTQWKDALAVRLAAAGQQAPVKDTSKQVPPLTVALANPDDIKATLQNTAQSLLGGYMSDADANAFVAQFQGQQRAAQTQAYYQQYDPNGGADGRGGYGPGGEAVAAPDAKTAAENFAKTTDPAQYTATQFGATVQSQLSHLRSTGYLS